SFFFCFSSGRRHTRFSRDWSSDVCSSDLRCRLALLAAHGASLAGPRRASTSQARRARGRISRDHAVRGGPVEPLTTSFGPGSSKIGRASCRERGEREGVVGLLKK